MDGSIRFRFAGREDIPLILRFIKELADYEGMLDQVVATEELLDQWLFEKQKAEVLLGSCGGETVGFALFLEPYQINGGGVAGLAMVFCTLSQFSSTGVVTIAVNIPLFIAGYKRLGKKFFFGSLLGTASSSVLLDVTAYEQG